MLHADIKSHTMWTNFVGWAAKCSDSISQDEYFECLSADRWVCVGPSNNFPIYLQVQCDPIRPNCPNRTETTTETWEHERTWENISKNFMIRCQARFILCARLLLDHSDFSSVYNIANIRNVIPSSISRCARTRKIFSPSSTRTNFLCKFEQETLCRAEGISRVCAHVEMKIRVAPDAVKKAKKMFWFADARSYQKPHIWCLVFMVSFEFSFAIVRNHISYDSQICLFSCEAKNIERKLSFAVSNVKFHPGNRWAYLTRKEIIKISSSTNELLAAHSGSSHCAQSWKKNATLWLPWDGTKMLDEVITYQTSFKEFLFSFIYNSDFWRKINKKMEGERSDEWWEKVKISKNKSSRKMCKEFMRREKKLFMGLHSGTKRYIKWTRAFN